VVIHAIPPVYDERSRVLILGSFPSVKSREQGFYYGHPQNRFWRVLAGVLERPAPVSVEQKRALLLSSGIALWDVIGRCTVTGSADSTIRDACPNDLTLIMHSAPIGRIFANGKTAEKYYNAFLRDAVGLPAVGLPSTSPANAAWSLERLIGAWRVIRDDL
jgi:TDG/mug DNA glycosylase family protein